MPFFLLRASPSLTLLSLAPGISVASGRSGRSGRLEFLPLTPTISSPHTLVHQISQISSSRSLIDIPCMPSESCALTLVQTTEKVEVGQGLSARVSGPEQTESQKEVDTIHMNAHYHLNFMHLYYSPHCVIHANTRLRGLSSGSHGGPCIHRTETTTPS
jgi:hypothetical protein